MAKPRKRKAGTGYSVGLETDGIEMHPPRTAVCTVCGTREDLKAEFPLFSFDRAADFNRKVEAFIQAHRPCLKKEGR